MLMSLNWYCIFFGFFFGLVIYLTIESKREGFPLESDGFGKRSGKKATGLLPMPTKRFLELSFTVILRHPMHGMMQLLRQLDLL